MPEPSAEQNKPSVTINPFFIGWKNVLLALLFGTTIIAAGLAGYYYFQLKGVKALPSISPPKAATSSAQKAEMAGWNTYRNETYGFEIKYPETYQIKENPKSEDFYHYLAEFSSPPSTKTFMSIVVVRDVDTYKNASPKFVAEREISDSASEYTITAMKVGPYNAALTKILSSGKETKASGVTVAHPNDNLFIEIGFEGEAQEFDKVLSTFQFID